MIAIFDFLVPVEALKKGVAPQIPIWVCDLKTHLVDILAYVELKITENMVQLQIEWYWFHSQIFLLGQKWGACPYLGIRFLAITQPFLSTQEIIIQVMMLIFRF